MVAAVRVHKAGGPEVLTFEDADIPAPGEIIAVTDGPAEMEMPALV